MKHIIFIFMLVVALFSVSVAEVPFKKGFNFSEWLQKSTAKQIQFTRFKKQDFINVKNMGCDHIRLPMHLFNMSGDAPDFTIDPLFFFFLDQIIDWAEELQLHLILDNHSFDPGIDTSAEILAQLIAVWKQMAVHYKNRSTLVYYEVLNEPHGINDDTWNEMQQSVIDAIRSIDAKHTIIVGPAGWNGYNNLHYMPEYADDNLIYTFHFYDPFLFTHQGATWVDPSIDISGVPYPYDPIRMPDLPNYLKGTWVEYIYNSYKVEGNNGWVKRQIDITVDFMNQRNVPLWCGEFGAFIPNSTTKDRARWLQIVRSYLEENGIAWSMWEFASGFGIYEPGSNGLFDYDVNIPIIQALGLTLPEQKEFILLPDTRGFIIYDDYIGHGIFEESWLPGGILNYYADDQPAVGNYCIFWTGVDQYGCIGLRLAPIKDMSQLVDKGYAIDFWVRCAAPSAKIDIRFVDTKTEDPGDHPWRMRYTIDANITEWNGEWQHLQIFLNEFTEHGSWDNEQWYNPQGEFDWTKIQQFEIVAEHHDLKGINFYFDNIRIVDPRVVHVDEKASVPYQFRLLQNYPNPFNPSTTIQFYLKKPEKVKLTIYNVNGQKVFEIKKNWLPAGEHSVTWFAEDIKGNQMPSGVYICKLESENETRSRRMVLLR